jgi:2-succinyl-6-hydroxy-2,4-cyclohexadiene-1-carboxylate synthase
MLQTIPHQLFGNHQKPVIFFLHGFMGEISDFKYFYNDLKDDFCLVGLSYPSAQTGFFEYLEQLKYFAEKYQCPRYFVGYSMGGRIGLGLSFHFPELFKKQIIISAHPGLGDSKEKSSRYIQDQNVLNEINDEQSWKLFLDKWYRQEIFGNLSIKDNYYELLKKDFMNFKNYKSQLYCFSLGLQDNYWSQKTPTHYIAGELDHKYFEIGKRFIENSKIHHLSIIPNTAHKCYFEDPAKTLALIKNTF